MADELVTRTSRVTRDKLAKFLPSQELIVAFESLTSDVGKTIPDAVNQVMDEMGETEALLDFAFGALGSAGSVAQRALALAERVEALVETLGSDRAALKVLASRIEELQGQIVDMAPQSVPRSLSLSETSNFSVYQTVAQPFAVGTLTNVTFEIELFDDLGEFSTATETFTAANAGIYIFNGGVYGSQLMPTRRLLLINVNAAQRIWLQDANGHTGNCMIAGSSGPVKLNAGDQVNLAYYTEIADTTTPGQVSTYFSGVRIK